MAIEKKLICFARLEEFERQLAAGNILDYSIVFIQDAKKIWTRGTYYDCNSDIKQNTLVSGTNIKTINGESILGEGDLTVEGGVSPEEGTSFQQVYHIIVLDEVDGGIKCVDGTFDTVVQLINSSPTKIYLSGVEVVPYAASNDSASGFVDFMGLGLGVFDRVPEAVISTLRLTVDDVLIPTNDTLLATQDSIPTATSQLENDSNFVSSDGLKTINGESIVGSGNIVIEGETLTESDITAMGFTKNTGTYSKPNGGIPKTDLASDIQTSLGKADTALQSVPSGYATETYVNNAIANAITTTLNTAV